MFTLFYNIDVITFMFSFNNLGGNGHLGNNLVRELTKRGKNVIAGLRNMNNTDILSDTDCQFVHTDLLDVESLKLKM